MERINNEKYIHVFDKEVNRLSAIHSIIHNNLDRDPFYVCDLGQIVERIREWNRLLPRVKPYYAIKSNDHPQVVNLMAAYGINFDCASKEEIDKVLNLGIEPNRIIYANTIKQISFLQHAAKHKVDLHTFDNETELYKYQKYYPTARLLIRIKCDDPKAQIQFGAKFGCDHLTEAPQLLQIAKQLDLNVVGVCFHNGFAAPEIFQTAISYSRLVFDAAKKIGYEFSILDIGGGMPGKSGISLDNRACIINNALETLFPDPKVEIIAEPGQFLVDASCTLACNIISKRTVDVNDPSTGLNHSHNMYYINEGVFGSFNNEVWYLLESQTTPLKKYDDPKLIVSDIWGQTCHSKDRVSKDVFLPDMEEGEWIIFEDMGAYSYTVGTNFNGFPMTKLYAIADKSLWLGLKDKLPFSEDDFISANKSSIFKTN